MGSLDYAQYAEPIIIQNAVARAITVASYSPDYFNIEIDSSGKAHYLTIKKETDGIYYIHIKPSQSSEAKTSYIEADPLPMISRCTITEIEKSLGEATKIYVVKELTDSGCNIEVSI